MKGAAIGSARFEIKDGKVLRRPGLVGVFVGQALAANDWSMPRLEGAWEVKQAIGGDRSHSILNQWIWSLHVRSYNLDKFFESEKELLTIFKGPPRYRIMTKGMRCSSAHWAAGYSSPKGRRC